LGIPKILHEAKMVFGRWSNLQCYCNGSELGHQNTALEQKLNEQNTTLE
jgi:hypothetical protein